GLLGSLRPLLIQWHLERGLANCGAWPLSVCVPDAVVTLMKQGTERAECQKRLGGFGPGTNEGVFAAWFQAPAVKNGKLGWFHRSKFTRYLKLATPVWSSDSVTEGVLLNRSRF